MIVINMNATNVATNNLFNNVTVFELDQSVTIGTNQEVCLNMLNINYSFPSVTSVSCMFRLTWIDGTFTTIFYPVGTTQDAQSFNALLLATMDTFNWYLLNGTQKVYYCNIVENATYYALQLNSYALPSVLPAGWSLPPGATWSLPVAGPASAKQPQFTIFDNQFSVLTGFDIGTYPPVSTGTAPYSKVSDKAPQLAPQSVINIRCSIAQSEYSTPDDLIGSVAIGNTRYGDAIVYQSYNPLWYSVKSQNIKRVIVTLEDALYTPLWILDRNYTIQIVIRDKPGAVFKS